MLLGVALITSLLHAKNAHAPLPTPATTAVAAAASRAACSCCLQLFLLLLLPVRLQLLLRAAITTTNCTCWAAIAANPPASHGQLTSICCFQHTRLLERFRSSFLPSDFLSRRRFVIPLEHFRERAWMNGGRLQSFCCGQGELL